MAWVLSTRGLVALALHLEPDAGAGAIAVRLGLSERRVQQVIAELLGAGQIRRVGLASRGRYAIVPEAPLREPAFLADVTLGEWLALQPGSTPVRAGRRRPRPARARARRISRTPETPPD
ncbi:MAG: hypothetical protein QOK40_684 [Miltoncostaeaceae bacterium]|nr:hypothetical protein [Miltoncostaeaceae bacterium]